MSPRASPSSWATTTRIWSRRAARDRVRPGDHGVRPHGRGALTRLASVLTPPGQAAVTSDGAQRFSVASRASRVATTSRSSPGRRRVVRTGMNGFSSRTTSVTEAPSGRRSSPTSTPASFEPGVHPHLQQVGGDALQRRGLHLDVARTASRQHPAPRGEASERSGLDERVDDDRHEDDVEQVVRALDVGGERDRGEDDRHRTAQSGPAQEDLLAPRPAEPDARSPRSTAAAPRTSGARRQRARSTRASPRTCREWRAGRASRTARSGPASRRPRRTSGSPGGAAARCCRARARRGRRRRTRSRGRRRPRRTPAR